jgi:hypothetical protein
MSGRRRSFAERYNEFAFPEPNSGCFIWMGYVHPCGYGMTLVRNADGSLTRYAHKAAYEYFVGPVPPGLEIDHLCRVRCCVNPDHLEPVTHSENVRRGVGPMLNVIRGRLKTHCKRGHLLSGANVYIKNGKHRICKTCKKIWAK